MARPTKDELAQHRRDIFTRAKHAGFYRRCLEVLDALEAKAKRSRKKESDENAEET